MHPWRPLWSIVLFAAAAASGARGQYQVLPAVLNNGDLARSVLGGVDINQDNVPDFVILWESSVLEARSGGSGATIWSLGLSCDSYGLQGGAASDFNFDGFPDVVLAGCGAVTIVSGFSGGVLNTFPNVVNVDYYRPEVLNANGDAFPDIAILDFPCCTGVSSVKLISGSGGGTLGMLTPPASSNAFGTSIAAIGDVTGDGLSEIVVGEPGPVFSNAYVMSAATGAIVRTHTVAGAVQFGNPVASLGDVDGDGVSDYAVGAYLYDPNGITDAGQVRVYSGATGLILGVANGAAPNEHLGLQLSGLGDYDGDGAADFAARDATGAKIFDASGVLLATIKGLDGNAFWSGPWLGGDLDGNGLSDVLVQTLNPFAVRTYSYAGVPPGSTPFGAGCLGPAGTPQLLAAGEVPVGTGAPAFGFELLNAAPNATAVLFAGQSTSSWQGVALPWMPAPVTMPGCAVFAAPEFLFPVATTNASGRAFFPLPVPGGMGFSGYFASFQCYVVNPGAVVIPGALTGALQILCL